MIQFLTNKAWGYQAGLLEFYKVDFAIVLTYVLTILTLNTDTDTDTAG